MLCWTKEKNSDKFFLKTLPLKVKGQKKKKREREKLLCNAVILITLPQNLHLSSDYRTYPEDQNKGPNPEAL